MKAPRFFRPPGQFHPFNTAVLIAVLNTGRNGGCGTVAVTANAKGYAVRINGRTLVKAATADELGALFEAEQRKVREQNAGNLET